MKARYLFFLLAILLLTSLSFSLVFHGDLDLNNDGYMDLVFSNYYNGSSHHINSTIYWGSPAGFSASNKLGIPTTGAETASIADLNNDGHLDIVFGNYYNGSSWNINSTIYWGPGFTTTTELPTHAAEAISIADLNNDGYLDIVFAYWWNDSSFDINSTIYWGSPAGFSELNTQGLPTHASVGNSIADLNYDGYLDILFSNAFGDSGMAANSTIYWGSPTGFSTANTEDIPTSGAFGNSIADLNNDGYLDVVSSNAYRMVPTFSFHTNSTIHWGSPAGFTTTTNLPTYDASGNNVADLNNDGYLDIVFSNIQNDTSHNINSTIYWGSPAGFSPSNYQGLPTHGAYGNTIADLNNDGYLDIVFSNTRNGTTSASFNINSTIYWGSPAGFSPSNTQGLPTHGATGNSIAIGKTRGANTAVGTTAGATLVQDFYIYRNDEFTDFIDLDIFFYGPEGYDIAAVGATWNVDIIIDPVTHQLSLRPREDWAGTIENVRFAATNGTHYAYSNYFNIYVLATPLPKEEKDEKQETPECRTDSDCFNECYYCSIANNKCLLLTTSECAFDEDCAEGYTCTGCECIAPEEELPEEIPEEGPPEKDGEPPKEAPEEPEELPPAEPEEIPEGEPPLPEPSEIAKDVVPLVESGLEGERMDILETPLPLEWILVPVIILGAGMIYFLVRKKPEQ